LTPAECWPFLTFRPALFIPRADTARGVSHDAPSRYIGFSEPDLTLDYIDVNAGPRQRTMGTDRAIGRSLPQAVLLQRSPEGTRTREQKARAREPARSEQRL